MAGRKKSEYLQTFIARSAATPAAFFRDAALIFYLLYACAPLLFSFGGGAVQNGDVQGSLLNQLVVVGALGVGLATAMALKPDRPMRGTGALIFLCLLALLSVTWSAYPDLALRRALRLTLESVTLILLVSGYRDPFSLLRVVAIAGIIVILLDIVMLPMPGSFSAIGYRGIHSHKNQAGSVMMVLLGLFLMAAGEERIGIRRPLALAMAALALLFMALSLSKTAAITTAACACLTVGLYALRNGRAQAATCFAAVFAAVLAYVLAVSLLNNSGLIGTLTGNTTLTGREYVWRYALNRIGRAPILGYGYGSFWGIGGLVSLMLKHDGITFQFDQAHNGYLDTLGALGLVGAIPTLMLLGYSALEAMRALKREGVTPLPLFICAMLVAFVLYNQTETVVLRAGTDLWVMFLIVALMTARLTMASPARHPAVRHPLLAGRALPRRQGEQDARA